jgi:adenine-specific DNA-methyltransferase
VTKKQKLELNWIGKDHRPKLEPRILIEDPAKSHHAKERVTDNDLFDNRLIFGDNLLALKALEQEFTGRIKCVYIDPPYNTGSAFAHYEDGIEHSAWLSMMRDRLGLLRRLLSPDGSIWIHLDDNEAHYCKVMCDEIFGRKNFLCDLIWEKRYSPPPDTKEFGYIHDHILCYRKSEAFKRFLLPATAEQKARYTCKDDDPRGPWKAMDYTCRYTKEERPNLYYAITRPSDGKKILPKKNRVWAVSKAVHEKNEQEGRLWWGKNGNNTVPSLKNFVSDVMPGMMPMSIWWHEMAGHNQEAKKESMALFPGNPFSTPKPERLIQHILHVSTAPGDLVLDSFAGSGTTGAVAHKMGRRWIMIEFAKHCRTHIIPRMRKVIDGLDGGGVTTITGWTGGGGYRYYTLAPSLLIKDKWDRFVINNVYNSHMLARAICKLEGFKFAPSQTVYWKHGYSTEHDFIYVTTNTFGNRQIAALSDEVGRDRTLLVMCSGFRISEEELACYANLTMKKIPKHIVKACEWCKDDYSLGNVGVITSVIEG